MRVESAGIGKKYMSSLGNFFLAFLMVFFCTAVSADEKFEEALTKVQTGKFQLISEGVALLVESDDQRVSAFLNALTAGSVYRYKKEKVLVYLHDKTDTGYVVSYVLSGETEAFVVPSSDLKRVGVNNNLRNEISDLLASLNLKHPDATVRLSALRENLGTLTPASLKVISKMAATETDSDVKALIDTAIVMGELQSADSAVQIQAISTLRDSLEPAVKQALQAVSRSTDDAAVAKSATKALKHIDERLVRYSHLETVFFGLSLGSVLVLAAIGLAITFGVMGVINMAHGELIMIGAYTTYVIQLMMPDSLEYSLFVAVPAAFLIAGAVGIVIERGVIRFLYGRPLETLLATFGVSLVLQQAVRTIFSPLNRSVETPEWMSGMLHINPVFSLTLNRLYIILFCLMVFAALFLVLRKTALGLQVRAVSQNRSMARAMGVRSEWVDAMTFGLGSGIAGVAGVALSQLTNVGPNMGQAYIIDSFMVVVFGGVGNLWGVLVAGLSLGVANKFLEPFAGAVLAKILVLVFIILFIQKRPRGLFPQKGRAAEG